MCRGRGFESALSMEDDVNRFRNRAIAVALLAATLFAARPAAAFISLDLPWYTPCLLPFVYLYDRLRIKPKEKLVVGGNEFVFYRELLNVHQRTLPGYSGPTVMSGYLARAARARVGGNSFVFARERVAFFYDGVVKEAKLAAAAKVKCGGSVFTFDSRDMREDHWEKIYFFGNGAVRQSLLAHDARVMIGGLPAVLASGGTGEHLVYFYPDGGVQKAMLAVDTELRARAKTLRFKGHTVATFFPDGTVMRGTLASPIGREESGVTMEVPAGSTIDLNFDGRIRGVYTGGPAAVDVHGAIVQAPAHSRVDFFPGGKVRSISVKGPIETRVNGIQIFDREYNSPDFHENGRLKRFYSSLKFRFAAGGRAVDCEPGWVSFHANGSLMEATVAEPFTAPLKGAMLTFKNGTVRFHDNGAVESGVPAGKKDCRKLDDIYFPGLTSHPDYHEQGGMSSLAGEGIHFFRSGAVKRAWISNNYELIRLRVKGARVMPESCYIGFHENGRPAFFELRQEARLRVNKKMSLIPAHAEVVLTPSGDVFSIEDEHNTSCVMNGRPALPFIAGHIAFIDHGRRIADGLAFEGVLDLFDSMQQPGTAVFANTVVEMEPMEFFDEYDDLNELVWVSYEDFHSFRVKALLFARDRRGMVNGRETRFPAFRWVDVAM